MFQNIHKKKGIDKGPTKDIDSVPRSKPIDPKDPNPNLNTKSFSPYRTTYKEVDQAQEDTRKDKKSFIENSKEAAKIILTSNTFYATSGTSVFIGLVTSVPEMALFYMTLGSLSVLNECREKLKLKQDSFSNSPLINLVKNPALFRISNAILHLSSAMLASTRGNFYDTTMLIALAVGNFAVAKLVIDETKYAINISKIIKQPIDLVKKYIPSKVKKLISNPAPSYLISDVLAASRNLTIETLSQSSLAATTYGVAALATISGLFLAGKAKIKPSLITDICSCQLALFSITNFAIGEIALGVSFLLYGLSSVFIAKIQKEKELNQQK